MKDHNPFKLELNANRFFQALGRVNLQTKKQPHFRLKSHSMIGIELKKLKPQQQKISLKKLQKKPYCSKYDLKQSLSQIILQHRQSIFSQLNIKVKQQAIQKMDMQKNTSISKLALQRKWFENDCQLLNKLKAESEQTLNKMTEEVDSFKKLHLSLFEQQNRLNNQIDKIQNNIFRYQQDLKSFLRYKHFLDPFLADTHTLSYSSPYLTVPSRQKPIFYPQNLLDKLSDKTELNLQQIQANYQLSDELSRLKRNLIEVLDKQLDLEKDYKERKIKLKGALNKQWQERLRRQNEEHSSETQVDISIVSDKIIDFHNQVFNTNLSKQKISEKQIKMILKDLQLLIMRMLQKSNNLKGRIKMQVEAIGKEIQVRKRNFSHTVVKQRRDVFRTIHEKKKQLPKRESKVVENDDSKYFS